MRHVKKLNVWINDKRVATIREQNGMHILTYIKDADKSDFISFNLPVRREPYVFHDGLPHCVKQNIPQGYAGYELRYLNRKTELTELEMLVAIGRNQIGRVSYTPANDNKLRPVSPFHIDKRTIQESDNGLRLFLRLSTGRVIPDGELYGVPGAQPKLLAQSVEYDDFEHLMRGDKGIHQCTARTLISTDSILKSDVQKYPHQSLNEYTLMSMAKYVGFYVADSYMSKDRTLLMVDRFDFNKDGSKIGFEDFASIMQGLKPETRDPTMDGGSYEGMFDALKSIDANKDVEIDYSKESGKLFARIVFANLTRDSDFHMKNAALVHNGKKCTLSPTYDVSCGSMYPVNDEMCLPWTNGGSCEWKTLNELIDFGVSVGIDRVEAGKTVQTIATRIIDWSNRFVQQATKDNVSDMDHRVVRSVVRTVYELGGDELINGRHPDLILLLDQIESIELLANTSGLEF